VRTYKIGGAPPAVLLLGGEIPQNTHRNKKGVVSDILDLSIKSPPISSAFVTCPLFQWYPQSKENLLNLGMKC
jgi:hypothetical protein